jgi:hypothetical protein
MNLVRGRQERQLRVITSLASSFVHDSDLRNEIKISNGASARASGLWAVATSPVRCSPESANGATADRHRPSGHPWIS